MNLRNERAIKTSMTQRGRGRNDSGLELMTASQSKTFGRTGRGMSFDVGSSGSATATIKPRIIESKISENPDFFNLSNGF